VTLFKYSSTEQF